MAEYESVGECVGPTELLPEPPVLLPLSRAGYRLGLQMANVVVRHCGARDDKKTIPVTERVKISTVEILGEQTPKVLTVLWTLPISHRYVNRNARLMQWCQELPGRLFQVAEDEDVFRAFGQLVDTVCNRL